MALQQAADRRHRAWHAYPQARSPHQARSVDPDHTPEEVDTGPGHPDRSPGPRYPVGPVADASGGDDVHRDPEPALEREAQHGPDVAGGAVAAVRAICVFAPAAVDRDGKPGDRDPAERSALGVPGARARSALRHSGDAGPSAVLSAQWHLIWCGLAAPASDWTAASRSGDLGVRGGWSAAVAPRPDEKPSQYMDRWRSVTPRRGGRLAYVPRGEAITPGSRITVTPAESPVISAMLFAFAPLHKRAFGMATGVAGAVLMMLLTVAGMFMPGAGTDGPVLPGIHRELGRGGGGRGVGLCRRLCGRLVRGVLPESGAGDQCVHHPHARRTRFHARVSRPHLTVDGAHDGCEFEHGPGIGSATQCARLGHLHRNAAWRRAFPGDGIPDHSRRPECRAAPVNAAGVLSRLQRHLGRRGHRVHLRLRIGLRPGTDHRLRLQPPGVSLGAEATSRGT